jgi:hypothetical protein
MKNPPPSIDIVMAYPQILLESAYFQITQAMMYRYGPIRFDTLPGQKAARALYLVRLHGDIDHAINVSCSAHQKIFLADKVEKVFSSWHTFFPEDLVAVLPFERLTDPAQCMFFDAAAVAPQRAKIKGAKHLYDMTVKMAKEHRGA